MAPQNGLTRKWIIEMSPRFKARLAGLLYLIVIVGGVVAEIFVRGRLIVHGDPATADKIMAHEALYRWGFTVELFYLVCNVPLTLLLYDLFKIVNRTAALLDVLFSFLSTAIEAVSLLGHYAPLILLGGHHLSAFTPEQLQKTAYVSLDLFEYGFAISPAFFGIGLPGDGVPHRQIKVLSAHHRRAAGHRGRVLSDQQFRELSRSLVCGTFLFHSGGFRGCRLWLLVTGVNEQRWNEQAGAAALVTA